MGRIPSLADYGSISKNDDINEVIEKLVDIVKSEPVVYVRQDIVKDIPLIISHAKDSHINRHAISVIASLLEDKDDSIKNFAAVALGDIGPPAKYTLPLLEKALEEEHKTEVPELKSFIIGWDSKYITRAIVKIDQ